MPKASTRKSTPARDATYRMLLELHSDDSVLLDKLVTRYQKVIGKPRGRFTTSNKALVIRQLIRHMAQQDDLPALIND